MELLEGEHRQRLASYHPGLERWFTTLPTLVRAYCSRWHLTLGPTFRPGGDASWAAITYRADGTKAVLKISIPDADDERSAAALRAYDGNGAVRLFEHEPVDRVWLIEHCDPGTTAASVPPSESDRAAADVLPRLWATVGTQLRGVPLLTDVIKARSAMVRERAERLDDPLCHRGADLLAELATVNEHDRLLHGDFNQRNVLQSERGWLAIDPRPMIGDPAYELAMWLVNRIIEDDDPVARATTLAERAGIPRTRVLTWVTVQTIQMCSWLRRSGERGDLAAYETAAWLLQAAV